MLGGVTLKHWAGTNRLAGIENKTDTKCPAAASRQHLSLQPRLGSCSGAARDGCARASQGAAPSAVPEQLLPERARQNLEKRYFQMASMNQTQSYGEGCALRVSQVSWKGTSTEHKYSYDNACAAAKNNPRTGKKHRTVVTTYFCVSMDKRCNTKKATFLTIES